MFYRDGRPFKDFDGIAIFIAVAEGGSLAAACRALGLPKATVSRRLAALERKLAVRLVSRSTRSMSLTDAGRALYERAAPLVIGLGAAAGDLRNLAVEPSGLVRVTASTAFGQTTLVPLINRFLRDHPKVRIQLLLSDENLNIVDRGIDIAVRMGPLDDSELVSRKLMDVELWLIASPDYLGEFGVPRSLADIEHHWAVVARPDRDVWHFEGRDGPVDMKVRWRFAVPGMQPQYEAALAGVGLALLPSRLATPAVKEGRLVRVELGLQTPRSIATILYPKGQIQSLAVRRLVDFFVQELGDTAH